MQEGKAVIKKETQEFEQALRAARAEALAAIRAALHASGDEAGSAALLNHLETTEDWAEADLLNDTDIAMLGNELVQLRDIDAALARIKDGTYGTCSNCGEPISADRLHALPVAQRCLQCQQLLEKQRGADHIPSL